MAGRLILVTVGTSALDRKKLDEPLLLWDSYQSIRVELFNTESQKVHSWAQGERIPRRISQFIDAYSETLCRLDMAVEIKKPPKETNVFSGEMTSLYIMYREPANPSERDPDLKDLDPQADTIVLLLSDSPEGVLCGLLHRKWLSEGRFLRDQDVVPELRIIDGLQIENLPQFLQKGLRGFSETLREYTLGQHKTPLLNATGGFKSLIPYSTFFSLAYGIPMFFVFEELPDLIAIKPPSVSPSEKDQLLGFVQQALRYSSPNLELTPSTF